MKDFRASVRGMSFLESDFSRIQVCETALLHIIRRRGVQVLASPKFCAELTSAMRFNFRQGLYKDVVAASQTPFIVVTCTIIERVVCPNVPGIKSTLQHAMHSTFFFGQIRNFYGRSRQDFEVLSCASHNVSDWQI
jgi:hypothetical protein